MSEPQQNNIAELRNLLFKTIRDLRKENDPIDVDRAKAISETAQTIINTAKVEIEFARESGKIIESEFIQAQSATPPALPQSTFPTAAPSAGSKNSSVSHPAPGVTVHKAK